MNDGAAVVALMSREKAEELGIYPWGRIKSYAVAGVDPRYMGIGPIPSTDKALKKAGLKLMRETIEVDGGIAEAWCPTK